MHFKTFILLHMCLCVYVCRSLCVSVHIGTSAFRGKKSVRSCVVVLEAAVRFMALVLGPVPKSSENCQTLYTSELSLQAYYVAFLTLVV